jgi:hypothetical protein
MPITFSSCFYIIKSKFDPETYIQWMTNFISIVNHFNLVIYSDENSSQYIPSHAWEHPKIKIIIKPLHEFHTYKYKDSWIKNHEKNFLLNDKIVWEVNMLWNEKIWFVNETIENDYFASTKDDNDSSSHFYGWCDIGYFRNRINDTHTNDLVNWANEIKINTLDKTKIHYACISNDNNNLKYLNKVISKKNSFGLPNQPIPPNQNSIAGGFFILHKDKMKWWRETYYEKLELYFKHDYLVKDDQIIVADCVFSNFNEFNLIRENDMKYDNWFLFQRYIS